MARCDHCGNECILPFTCQHCGGKYCPDCRLPPSHGCAGIRGWNAKPAPATGMRYARGGAVTATGGIRLERRKGDGEPVVTGFPYLKVMIGIILLILAGIAWLILNGMR